MKTITISKKTLLLISCLTAVNAKTVPENYYYESNESGLLNCGSINILVHGGVAPTVWRNRGDFSAVSCFAASVEPINQNVIPLFTLPKFNKLFHLPWIVGGQIGYAISDCSEIYVELNYRQASRKTFVLNNIAIPNDTINVALNLTNKFRAIDAYVGARAYWGRYWCDRVAFFLGAKFGIVHHKSMDFNYILTPQSVPAQLALVSISDTSFTTRNTSPAGGANIGFDWSYGCGWSIVFMAEIVATCAPKSNAIIPLANTCTQLPSLLPNAFLLGGNGTELFFPITLGLKYSF